MFLSSEVSFGEVTLALLNGCLPTLAIFFSTIVFAVPLGFLVCWLSKCKWKPVSVVTRFVIWMIRGTPLMLQIMVVFYVPSLVFHIKFNQRLLAACLAFIINYAAYFSEIYRGGLGSIATGQYEACRVLGFTRAQTFFRVILPQLVKRILPAMGNEILTLVKDTSLANIIAVTEIIMSAKEIMRSSAVIWPLFYTGVFYLAMCGILTLLFRFAEKKLEYYKG